MNWLQEARTGLAAERILDAAADLFVDQGVNGPGMDEIARAAGCSRATLYRYFDSRRALQQAFAHREAVRVIEEVARKTKHLTNRQDRVTEIVLLALHAVRARPQLHAWYATSDVAVLHEILNESTVIETFALSGLQLTEGTADRDLARWVVRSIVSMLTFPGADAAEERRLVERFVAPLVPPT